MSGARFPRRAVLGGGVAAAAAAVGVAEGLVEAVATPRRGTLADVEHVVILMQENRSFDHYFGTMAGVRGFGDRTALRLPPGGIDPGSQAVATAVAAALARNTAVLGTAPPPPGSAGATPGTGPGAERSVLWQPSTRPGGVVLPFHVDTTRWDGQDLGDLPHDWNTTHQAWAGGAYHSWVAAKSEMAMGYFTAADIPFHRALAEAFTVCDNYFCSIQGPTSPNRLYLWTGTIDPEGRSGGPATFDAPDYRPVYGWTTYPERLQRAGISWQVFANDQTGNQFLGDYGDNPLWLFHAYHDALASPDPAVRELARRANVTGHWRPAGNDDGRDVDHVLAQFISACERGALPQVSWIVAPQGYSEHPAARPVDGEAYLQRVLKALWDHPKLWESTVLLVNYDENDGLFDHVVPPTAPPGTPGEMLPANQPGGGTNAAQLTAAGAAQVASSAGLPSGVATATSWGPPTPIGLGPRVPMLVISPWSRGGWVNSQVFDHTSVLRFLEEWTGVREPNISAWRRAVCGDLISCFDFAAKDTTIPLLPNAAALRAQADRTQAKLPPPRPPVGDQPLPVQDPWHAKARPLPYQPAAWLDAATLPPRLHCRNTGSVAVQFQVYSYHNADNTIQQILVAAGGAATATVPAAHRYDIAVHGPNGFLIRAAGDAATSHLTVEAAVTGAAAAPVFSLTLRNSGTGDAVVTMGGRTSVPVRAGTSRTVAVPDSDGWYDVRLTAAGHDSWHRHFTGHLENGRPSRTG